MTIHAASKVIQRNGSWAIRNMVSRPRDQCNTFLSDGAENVLNQALTHHSSIAHGAPGRGVEGTLGHSDSERGGLRGHRHLSRMFTQAFFLRTERTSGIETDRIKKKLSKKQKI